MRTLCDIIESAKDGEKPTYDECYYSVLVLVGLLNMASNDVRRMADERKPETIRRLYSEENHRRYHEALNTDPQSYLGDEVPGNPEYDRFRSIGKRIIDRVIAASSAGAGAEGE